MARTAWLHLADLAAACRLAPTSAAEQTLLRLAAVFTTTVPSALNWAGYNSAMVSWIGSVARVPMKRNGPGGGVTEVLALGLALGLADGRCDLLATDAAGLDPNVRLRLQRAADIAAADYILNMRARIAAIAAMDRVFVDFDALVLPTAPIVAPTMVEVADPDDFARRNMLLLRNTAIANFFDLCAISLPVRLGNSLPCGLMLFGPHGNDRKLLQLAATVERVIAA